MLKNVKLKQTNKIPPAQTHLQGAICSHLYLFSFFLILISSIFLMPTF